jgi:hypothetical protein
MLTLGIGDSLHNFGESEILVSWQVALDAGLGNATSAIITWADQCTYQYTL